MPYNAPILQITHTLARIARLDELAATGAFPNFDPDLVAPILDEANKLARDVLAPLNPIGHKSGAKLGDNGVIAAPGLADAYRQFVAGGWMGLAFPEAFGGQGLPKPLALAVFEMIHGANMSFGLCPLLSFGAIEALLAHGSPELQQMYLPKLISGEWTGAMNLTEPQAGSDVGALITKATPNGDGSYSISGQKIYITWGDHDMTENIIQLVLARLPDAPAGSRGISLFVAPKFLVNPDGSLGERNAFKCIGLEHKMGIHASPTCVMEYSGARGWLVGEENKGLAAMFTMMNSARLNVGLEGVAVGEAALQAGVAYAKDRKQGAIHGESGAVPIIRHPDVQRMLMTMAANVQAARAICYACGAAADIAEHHPDEGARKQAKAREDLLTPLAKAWSTDRAIDVTNLGVQIHGGMGFMDTTAAAQFYLDARITPIYEGTNGIQSMDLLGRKVLHLDLFGSFGAPVEAYVERHEGDERMAEFVEPLAASYDLLEDATRVIRERTGARPEEAGAAAVDYMRLFALTAVGYLFARAAEVSLPKSNADFHRAKLATARFFMQRVLPDTASLHAKILAGAGPVMEMDEAMF